MVYAIGLAASIRMPAADTVTRRRRIPRAAAAADSAAEDSAAGRRVPAAAARRRRTIPTKDWPKIAGVTGGGYFELTSTSDLAATFSRVADELHRQYALGFTPDKLDGKMHTLEVRVAGDGMTVRARKSYLAGRPPVRASPGGRSQRGKS